jgi:hypothetical protein
LDQTAVAEAETREAAALVPEFIALDLEMAGYTTDQGQLAWMQSEELAVFKDVASNFVSQPLEPAFIAANFIFGTDLEWDYDRGWASCGVIFRAAAVDKGVQAQFNVVFVNPTAYPEWSIELWDDGEYQSTFGDGLSDSIQQGKGTTNHFLIVADGTNVTLFANGIELVFTTVEVTPNETRLVFTPVQVSLTEGEFGILAGLAHGLSYVGGPGTVSCAFRNTWIWELP